MFMPKNININDFINGVDTMIQYELGQEIKTESSNSLYM